MLRTPGQREHLCEGRDTGTIVRTLLGQRGGIGSPRLEPAHVVAFELFQGEGIDWRPALGEEGAICSAGDIGVEPFVVMDDNNPVLAHAHVQLQGRNADRQSRAEGFDRVLRSEAARAAVALKIESDCREACSASYHGL